MDFKDIKVKDYKKDFCNRKATACKMPRKILLENA
jgi:hypothetical protein